MRYPDNALAGDEHVVLHRHPHWTRLVGAVLALIVATGLATFVAAVVNTRDWDPTAKNVIFAVIWAIWLVLAGWLTLWPFLNWATTHFVVTDRRVMSRHGLLTRSEIDIPLARISHVGFRHRIVQRLVRAGTLTIECASQDPVEFYDVPRVRRVHALLCQEVLGTREFDESGEPPG